ncbi:MAG TPA: hypothetical protein VNV85_08825 [Puia sp.]|jgi:hypothetical protein|nr:hypothetical protein [Puia sp.]
MNKFLLTVFLLASFQAFPQFDYELFKSFNGNKTKELNKKLISATEYKQDKNVWIKISLQRFNLQGLPTTLIKYDELGKEAQKKEFVYDSAQSILKIEGYKNGVREETTEFEINSARQIISYTDYVYSYYDGKKILVWKTILEYNPNGRIKKTIRLEGDKKDPVETNFYDTSGILAKSLWNLGGLRTTKIEYIWNSDSTEMKELHYENDSTTYNTITHKFKDRKEIKKIDSLASTQPFYWKYDDNGRIIETNEQLFYVQYFQYGLSGYLTNKTINVLFSDSGEKDLPKKIEFKYDYKFRN